MPYSKYSNNNKISGQQVQCPIGVLALITDALKRYFTDHSLSAQKNYGRSNFAFKLGETLPNLTIDLFFQSEIKEQH